ncbi:MAG: apolipoprotein N-acyltransferase, partial [Chlamydiia bacterium]|nr:apolipoprotein N-acyltransferase [Chlamydiia bacterium]
LLVNVTSDVWFPHSRLPIQHLEHGRLRTVENGVPLVRACNTGVTAAVDALGRTIEAFGDADGPYEWKSGALYVQVPLFRYDTLYRWIGQDWVLGIAAVLFGLGFLPRRS